MQNIQGVLPCLCAKKADCSSCTNQKNEKYSTGPLYKQSEVRRLQLWITSQTSFLQGVKNDRFDSSYSTAHWLWLLHLWAWKQSLHCSNHNIKVECSYWKKSGFKQGFSRNDTVLYSISQCRIPSVLPIYPFNFLLSILDRCSRETEMLLYHQTLKRFFLPALLLPWSSIHSYSNIPSAARHLWQLNSWDPFRKHFCKTS